MIEHDVEALAVPDVGQAALEAGGFRGGVDAIELLVRDDAVDARVDVVARAHRAPAGRA